MGFILGMQGQYDIFKSINVTYYINKMKNKNHMIILVDTEKAFEKIQHPYIIKSFSKVVIQKTYLSQIKAYMATPQLTTYSIYKNYKHFP